jgi:carnitine monooxygenase subunit
MSVAEMPNLAAELDPKARQRQGMLGMQRRLVAHLAAGRTTDFAPDVMEVDPRIYTDPRHLEAERRELFLKLPLLAAFSSDLPNAGDVMLFEAAGPSILLARGKDGKVRAFLNRCRHRAAKVVTECKNASRLTCPFHGWTYDLEGRLIGLPGEAAFEGVDRAASNLIPVPVGEWSGLIFVKAHPGDEAIDVESFLGALAPEIAQLDLANTTPVRKHRVDLAANWKFAQDTFFEGYHFATLHPTTIAQAAVTNVMVHDEFAPHQRVMMPSQDWLDYVGQPEEAWVVPPYQGIHLIFPNTIFYSGHANRFGKGANDDRQIFGCWRSFPGETPGEAFTLMATYRPTDVSAPDELAYFEDLSALIMRVIETEDYSLCNQAQMNLETSPPGSKILFGRNECANQAIHRQFAAHVGPLEP